MKAKLNPAKFALAHRGASLRKVRSCGPRSENYRGNALCNFLFKCGIGVISRLRDLAGFASPKVATATEGGPLAQLARAPPWHGGGHRFESGTVHNLENPLLERFFCCVPKGIWNQTIVSSGVG